MLTDSECQRYVNEGYIVAKNLVDSEPVASMAEELDRFVTGEISVENPRPSTMSADEKRRSVLAVNFPHRASERIRNTVTLPGLIGVLERITAAHLAHWDGSTKHVQSIYYNKPPGHPGQPWHQDEIFLPTRDRSLTGAWIALDDADRQNGCLWVIPGSHRSGYIWPTRATKDESEFVRSDESYGFDTADGVAVEVERGDVVFFNGYLLHASRRNRSERFRRALVHHYCNAWGPLPTATPPREISTTEIGVLNNRAIIPLAADPYEASPLVTSTQQVFLRPFL